MTNGSNAGDDALDRQVTPMDHQTVNKTGTFGIPAGMVLVILELQRTSAAM